MKKEVLVINYHQIDTGKDNGIPEYDRIYSVQNSFFESQIRVLIKNAIPVVTLNDILNNNISSPFSVAITVDDGSCSDYEIIYPFLNRNNIKATFFLLTNKEINWEQIIEMNAHGFAIGSHGIAHRDLTKLDVLELRKELEHSKKLIEEKAKQKVEFFSLPFGRYNQKVLTLGKAIGYKAMLSTDVRLNNPGSNSFIIHRWSVKRTTSVKDFEKTLLNQGRLKRKIHVSKIKKILLKVLGKPVSDQLNMLLNKLCK